MNIYFLVEGKTERKVYPKWLSYLVPKLNRVHNPSKANNDNYYLISGGGYPNILDNHLVDSVNDVNSLGNFNFLVLALDSHEMMPHEKIDEINQFVSLKNIKLINCELVIIPQSICIETWFLGNRKIYSRSPLNHDCAVYSKYYDVSKYNPELMIKPSGHIGTSANYHYEYLKIMLREKNIRYSKSNPREVQKLHYVDELKNRLRSDTSSLSSMNKLFKFFDNISGSIDA